MPSRAACRGPHGHHHAKVDLQDARRAFVHAFVVIAERLPTLPDLDRAHEGPQR